MHELGIVSGILRTVTSTAREAKASRVVSVRLRIGDMCAVVSKSFDMAWEVLREDDPLTATATYDIERVGPRSRCLVCGEEFSHDNFHVRCPACGSANTQLLAGRELELVNMEVEFDGD